MATSVLGSPEKTHNALKQRYLQSLQNSGLNIEPLQKTSSSRINSLNTTKRKISTSIPTSPSKSNLFRIKQSYDENTIPEIAVPKTPSKQLKDNSFFRMNSEALESKKIDFSKSYLGKPTSSSFALKSLPKNTPTERKNEKTFSNNIKASENKDFEVAAITMSKNTEKPKSVSKISNSFEKFDTKQFSAVELRYYEFLCRAYETKEWVEAIIEEDIPSVLNITTRNALKDGVALAKLAQKINSSLVPQVHPSDTKFKYKLLENIQNFLLLVDTVGVPKTFKFETTDLYDGKNIPQVFETLHALAYTLHKKWPNKVPAMVNEYGSVSFTKEDIRDCKLKFPYLKNFQFFGNDYSITKKTSQSHDNDLVPDFGKIDRVASTKNIETKTSNNTEDIPTDTKKVDIEIQKEASKQTFTNNSDEEESKMDSFRNFSVVVKAPISIELSPHKDIDEFDSFASTTFDYTSKLKDIPTIDYTPRNDLSYYSQSISSQFSPRRRRRRRGNMGFEESQFDSSLSSTGSTYSNPFSTYSASDNYDQYSVSDYSSSSYSYSHNYGMKPRATEVDHTKLANQFQAICKGTNVRYSLYSLDFKLELFEEKIVHLQAVLRRKLVDSKLGPKIKAGQVMNGDSRLAEFQALIKGTCLRLKYDKLMFQISRHSYSVEHLQAFAKGNATRKRVSNLSYNIKNIDPIVIKLQGVIQGGNVRARNGQNISTLGSSTQVIINLQSLLKASIQRKQITAITSKFENSIRDKNSLLLLQSNVRGHSARSNVLKTKKLLGSFSFSNDQLVSFIKGAMFRDKFYEKMYAMECEKDTMTQLQSHIKGVLARYAVTLVHDVVDESTIILLQKYARGCIVRNNIKKTNAYYNKNVRHVVTLQSKIRAWAMEKAYHEIMDFANPSLWAVQKFAFLLNGVQPTYELQDSLDSLKERIDKANLDNNRQEQNLRKIAKKIELLKKNGVVKNHLSPDVMNILEKLKSKTHIEDSETIGLYEKIFYLLEVDPFYFRLLFSVNPEKVKKYLMLLFFKRDGSIEDREAVLFVKLISEMLLVDIESRANVEDFLLEQHDDEAWKQMLHVFLVSQQKPLMSNLFAGIIQSLDNSTVSFEGNPSIIYNTLYSSDINISPQDAIEDEATNKQYVANMCNLWTFIEEIHQIITQNIEHLPIEILHLCTKAYTSVAAKSADEFDALEGISKVIIGAFVNDYLLKCDEYGAQLQNPAQTFQKLRILSDALSTVFSMRKFKGFYSQLNSYVEEVGNEIASTLQNLQITPAYEERMESMIYNDMNERANPLLTINVKYLSEITDFIHQNVEMFPEDDPLVELIHELQDLDNHVLFKRSVVINLELNPSAYILCDVSDRGKPLYNNVMWGLIYILQICSARCSSVLEILTKPEIQNENDLEAKFQNLLATYPSIQKNSVFKQLPAVSYLDLKMYVTEKTLELSNMAFIDRSGDFQCLLNDISNTIKCHVYVKTRSMKEIDAAKQTLKMLTEKQTRASVEYSLLKKGFDATLGDVKPVAHLGAKKKGLGSKLKDIVHTKNNKDLDSTRHKWSLRQLYEKGVLLQLDDQKLENLPVNYFGSGGIKYPNIDFVFSTANGKDYVIEMQDNRKGREYVQHSDKFNFENMLDQIGSSSKKIVLIHDKVTFNSKKLFNLIIESFLT